jgi:hypothetical protein
MSKYDDQEQRWVVILGNSPDQTAEDALNAYFKFLKANLKMPCEVTGIEDFNWEEPYVVGGWSHQEYKELKKTQPSFKDKYELLDINQDESSEWMMFDDDIVAHARRISDGKEFILGLSELKLTDNKSRNFMFVDDYVVWFVNNR